MNQEMTVVKKVAEQVNEAGGKMYFVGGFVRDRLIGKDSKDIDVEIHGINEEQLVSILSTHGGVDKVGESFGVYLVKGIDVDFALPRIERQTGLLHTDFDVTIDPFIGTYGASKRRDFTMNAIMEDVLTGEVVDHFGGQEDIRQHVIRFVDEETFQEDALRVLRAIQFSARFGFSIDKETRSVAEKMDLHHLAKERVYEEIRKGMTKGSPAVFVAQLKTFPNIVHLLTSLNQVDGGLVKSGRTFALNVGMMGTIVEEKDFNVLVTDFIQTKQERKTAQACRAFMKDMMTNWVVPIQVEFLELIAIHRAFIEKHPESNELVDLYLPKEHATLFHQAMVKKTDCSLQIDGNWLIERGVNPSPAFAEMLRQANVMAWNGESEETILKSIMN